MLRNEFPFTPKTDILLLNKICVFIGFPGDAANAGDVRVTDLILGSGRSPGEGNGNLLQYSCLEKSHGQKSLVGYSPRGHKELNVTE